MIDTLEKANQQGFNEAMNCSSIAGIVLVIAAFLLGSCLGFNEGRMAGLRECGFEVGVRPIK